MIYGTGVDIVEIDRIKQVMDKHAGRFEEKIFSANEISYSRSKADPARHFAGRFAAKEAVLKALGTGFDGHISWKEMEVLNHEKTGRPYLRLSGKGKIFFDKLKLKNIHISISHEKLYAIAHAIAEK
ncbi:MAG: holo-ACP synthase [Nitrospinales bacterium]